MRSKRRLRLFVGAVIWIALLGAVATQWTEVEAGLRRAGLLFPLAAFLIVIGLGGGAASWAMLQPDCSRRRAFLAFVAAQPAKYLPVGGLAQAIGQVGLSSPSGETRVAGGVAFLIHSIVQVLAAGCVGLLAVLSGTTPRSLIAVPILAALGSILLLRQATLSRVLRGVASLVPRWNTPESVPTTRQMWSSWAWVLVPLILSGSAFAALLGLWPQPRAATAAVGGFAVAWAVGFLAVPLPSGVGARELVLVTLISAVPPSTVVAVSLVHRFATLAAEAVLLIVVSRSVFRKQEESA